MRRKPTLAPTDPRPQWQIDQGRKCSCKGTDDYCPCQNVARSDQTTASESSRALPTLPVDVSGDREGADANAGIEDLSIATDSNQGEELGTTRAADFAGDVARLLADLERGRDKRSPGDPVREEFERHIETARRFEVIEKWRGTYDGRDMTPAEVLNELRDYLFMLEQVPLVYCHVTGGLLSKPNYYASQVISAADDHIERLIDDEIEDRRERPGNMHTAFLEALKAELISQRPNAFEEDSDAELVFPCGAEPRTAFLKLDVSALAEAALGCVSSNPSDSASDGSTPGRSDLARAELPHHPSKRGK